MRHLNSVRQLGMRSAHRKAMFDNMVTSLFRHERIVTTRQKGKELKRISEKLITRAKKNLSIPEGEGEKKLHNKREVMKVIKDRDVVKKLFETIAPRYAERKGGYTRIYLLGTRRAGDAAEMAIVELVDRQVIEKKAKGKAADKSEKKEAKEKKEKVKKEKKEKVKEK